MAAAQPKKVNWFVVWVTTGVVIMALLIAAVVWLANTIGSGMGGPIPESEHISSETGAISYGDGDQTLDTYVDFMCPICNQFEQAYGGQIAQLRDDGTITLNLHPIAILDRASQGTEYSTRAANAMYAVAVADYDRSYDYMQALFANQPQEGSAGLTDDQLLDTAEAVGITVTDDLREAVEKQRYAGFVARMTGKTPIQPGQDGIATPTIAVNGEVIANPEIPADLATLFQ